jgi:hypothetical protein
MLLESSITTAASLLASLILLGSMAVVEGGRSPAALTAAGMGLIVSSHLPASGECQRREHANQEQSTRRYTAERNAGKFGPTPAAAARCFAQQRSSGPQKCPDTSHSCSIACWPRRTTPEEASQELPAAAVLLTCNQTLSDDGCCNPGTQPWGNQGKKPDSNTSS